MTEEATNSEEFSTEEETSLPESAEQSETQETEAEESEEGAEEAEKPKKPTAKDRIDELTKLRREAERDAEYWKAKALQAPTPQQETPPAPTAKQRPDPSAYDAGEYDPRYIEDLTDWKAESAVAKAVEGLTAKSEATQADTQFRQLVSKVAETLPDFEDKVIVGAQRGEWACTPEMAQVLRSDESGLQLAYHLATNPDEAARIARLSPVLQIKELGKLEAKLDQPKPKTATSAPTPIAQVRGSGGKFKVAPDTNDFAAFDQAYGSGS